MALTHPAKRRSKPRALVRGEPVVRGVMEATMQELAGCGYSALRIEEVAARAGVNKTTVYRRWPTKEELVRAALQSITAGRVVAPNTGSLRTDMLEMARAIVAMGSSCEGQGLFRMVLAAGPDSELMAIAKSLKAAHESVPRSVIEAAATRGELAPGIDAMLLVQRPDGHREGAALHRSHRGRRGLPGAPGRSPPLRGHAAIACGRSAQGRRRGAVARPSRGGARRRAVAASPAPPLRVARVGR